MHTQNNISLQTNRTESTILHMALQGLMWTKTYRSLLMDRNLALLKKGYGWCLKVGALSTNFVSFKKNGTKLESGMSTMCFLKKKLINIVGTSANNIVGAQRANFGPLFCSEVKCTIRQHLNNLIHSKIFSHSEYPHSTY